MAKNNKQIDKLVEDIDIDLNTLRGSLEEIRKIVDELQAGENGKMPYWNGANAYNIIKSVLAQVDNDGVLADYIDDCRQSLKK